MPLLDLLQVQAGTEGAWGTPATPTVKLMGVEDITLDPGIEAQLFHDRRGGLAPGYLAALTAITPSGKADVLGTYEDIAYYLDNVFGQAAPSGAGPYTRAYAAPIGTAPSPRILTLAYGDATDCYRLEGLLISKLTLKGENGAPMRLSAEFVSKNIGAGALAALNDRTVTVSMGDHMALFVDTWVGTIGSTALATAAFAYELTLDAKRKTDQYLGSLTAGNWHEDDGAEGWSGELKLSLELNGASRAQLTALASTSALYQRQVRLAATSGTNVIRFDFAGSSLKAPTLFEDRDGVATFETTLTGTYCPVLGNWVKAQVVNSVTTLA